MTEIKLTKRYPNSRTEDITDAYMRGWNDALDAVQNGKFIINDDRKTENSSEKPNNCEKCKWWNESYGCHWKEGVCHYVPKAIIPKQCVSCDSASRIIKAYSQGFKDGADAVKAMPQTFTADGIVFAKMDEPQTEKNYCDDCLYTDTCDDKAFFYACTSKPTISKMEQVETMSCQECKHFHENAVMYLDQCDFCFKDCKYEPKDEPQTEEHCENCRHKDECEGATYEYKNTEWWCLAYAPIDEPQTEYKKWETPPKFEHKEIITTCVSVPACLLEIEDEPQTDCPWK